MARYPQKILMLTRRLKSDGPSAFLLQMCRSLQERGVRVNILCGRSSLPASESEGIEIIELAALFEQMPLKMLFGKAASILGELAPDIIHVMGQETGYTGYRVLMQSKSPFVMTVFPPVKMYHAFGQISRRCRRIIAWSEDVREELVNDIGCQKHKVAIVPPGIDVDLYPPNLPFSTQRPPTIGVAGTITRKSGFDIFIEAAAKVLEHFKDVNFIVAGDGSAERHVRAVAVRNGIAKAVSFVQRSPNYRQPMECMDIFVEPSLVEIFPAALLEAMAFGKAVVAGGVGGVYSIIADGHSGLIAKKGDRDDIAESIMRLLIEPEKARELGRNARSQVRERFNMEQTLDRLMPVYEQAMKTGGRQAAQAV